MICFEQFWQLLYAHCKRNYYKIDVDVKKLKPG